MKTVYQARHNAMIPRTEELQSHTKMNTRITASERSCLYVVKQIGVGKAYLFAV